VPVVGILGGGLVTAVSFETPFGLLRNTADARVPEEAGGCLEGRGHLTAFFGLNIPKPLSLPSISATTLPARGQAGIG
jgi:hypothetical protein